MRVAALLRLFIGFGTLAGLTAQGILAAAADPAPAAASGGSPGGSPPTRSGRDFTPEHPRSLKPYFTPADPTPRAPDEDGFLRRWLLLEPIRKPIRSNTVFTDSYVRANLTTNYFPGQLSGFPRHGEKATVSGEELAWHALDSANFNVKLFRFADGVSKPTYGVIFWAVTVVNSPEEMKGVRLAVGSNSASLWWLNGKEAVLLSGDRRMVMDDCVSSRLTLHKGQNILRGAVINGPGMSDFCVRFIDENGQPVRNLALTLEPAPNP